MARGGEARGRPCDAAGRTLYFTGSPRPSSGSRELAMKLQPDLHPDTQIVSAYGPGYVEVNGTRHTTSCVFGSRLPPQDWAVPGFDALTEAVLQPLLSESPEVVLIGTGLRQRFPATAVLRSLIAAGIGWEVMDTAAACRTYNILAGEGRRVVAALIVESPQPPSRPAAPR